jgi:hypothetical protein
MIWLDAPCFLTLYRVVYQFEISDDIIVFKGVYYGNADLRQV